MRESDIQCNNVKNSINCPNVLDRRHKKAKKKTKTKKWYYLIYAVVFECVDQVGWLQEQVANDNRWKKLKSEKEINENDACVALLSNQSC